MTVTKNNSFNLDTQYLLHEKRGYAMARQCNEIYNQVQLASMISHIVLTQLPQQQSSPHFGTLHFVSHNSSEECNKQQLYICTLYKSLMSIPKLARVIMLVRLSYISTAEQYGTKNRNEKGQTFFNLRLESRVS